MILANMQLMLHPKQINITTLDCGQKDANPGTVGVFAG